MKDAALGKEEKRHDKTLDRLGYRHVNRGRMVKTRGKKRKRTR